MKIENNYKVKMEYQDRNIKRRVRDGTLSQILLEAELLCRPHEYLDLNSMQLPDRCHMLKRCQQAVDSGRIWAWVYVV